MRHMGAIRWRAPALAWWAAAASLVRPTETAEEPLIVGRCSRLRHRRHRPLDAVLQRRGRARRERQPQPLPAALRVTTGTGARPGWRQVARAPQGAATTLAICGATRAVKARHASARSIVPS